MWKSIPVVWFPESTTCTLLLLTSLRRRRIPLTIWPFSHSPGCNVDRDSLKIVNGSCNCKTDVWRFDSGWFVKSMTGLALSSWGAGFGSWHGSGKSVTGLVLWLALAGTDSSFVVFAF